MLQNIHNKIKVQFSEKYHYVFETSKDEGRVCKQCFTIIATL
jgi:hypothetical protein